MSDWTTSVPAHVTRETADGMIMTYSMPAWLYLLVCMLATLNATLWGFVGLYEFVKFIL